VYLVAVDGVLKDFACSRFPLQSGTVKDKRLYDFNEPLVDALAEAVSQANESHHAASVVLMDPNEFTQISGPAAGWRRVEKEHTNKNNETVKVDVYVNLNDKSIKSTFTNPTSLMMTTDDGTAQWIENEYCDGDGHDSWVYTKYEFKDGERGAKTQIKMSPPDKFFAKASRHPFALKIRFMCEDVDTESIGTGLGDICPVDKVPEIVLKSLNQKYGNLKNAEVTYVGKKNQFKELQRGWNSSKLSKPTKALHFAHISTTMDYDEILSSLNVEDRAIKSNEASAAAMAK